MPASAGTSEVGSVLPSIEIGSGATDLSWDDVLRVVVDGHLHLPDMFEITFRDGMFGLAQVPGLAIGAPVQIWAGSRQSTSAGPLIDGEVTSIEGAFSEAGSCRAVVRGYTKDHRMQRAHRTRTFVNMTDSDIAGKIAKDAGLESGDIEPTMVINDHVGQVNQTDWDFLNARARAIGYETGVADGKFYFRKASNAKGKPGEVPVDLVYEDNLLRFNPRITAGNLAEEVEVRGWDNVARQSLNAKVPIADDSTKLDNETADKTAREFGSTPRPSAPPASNPALGNLGPAPSEKAHVVSVAVPTSAAADAALRGASGGLGGTFAEAEGEADGDPGLRPGAVVEVSALPEQFIGKWVITRARHVFDPFEYGYRTHFEATGRQERSLLGLTSRGAGGAAVPVMNGLVVGLVSNVLDDQKIGRVKVTLPWLSPQYETDWAPVVQLGAGPRSGAMFLPEVGDQVLVGFELGDPQRPFVLGGVLNKKSDYPKVLGGAPTKSTNAAGDVVWRGLVSPSGNRLAFHDELPPGAAPAPPTASEIVLGTQQADLSLAIDQVKGTVALTCNPTTAQGKLTIECGKGGAIDIKTGPNGTVNIDGGAQLNLKAMGPMGSIKIQSTGALELKGNPIKLN